MNNTVKGALAATAITVASATGAFAQACEYSDIAAQALAQGYGEVLVETGEPTSLNGVEYTPELFANELTGTWTEVANIESEGVRCQLSDGTDYPNDAPSFD